MEPEVAFDALEAYARSGCQQWTSGCPHDETPGTTTPKTEQAASAAPLCPTH